MTAHAKPRSGGCHCGAVRFTADLPDHIVGLSCNCSICAMTGFIHVIVEPDDFHLEKGEDAQNEYMFNTHTARHLFCRTCGVKSWYYPRAHPGKISVNLRCFDSDQNLSGRIVDFDGANWEKNVNEINPEMSA